MHLSQPLRILCKYSELQVISSMQVFDLQLSLTLYGSVDWCWLQVRTTLCAPLAVANAAAIDPSCLGRQNHAIGAKFMGWQKLCADAQYRTLNEPKTALVSNALRTQRHAGTRQFMAA